MLIFDAQHVIITEIVGNVLRNMSESSIRSMPIVSCLPVLVKAWLYAYLTARQMIILDSPSFMTVRTSISDQLA
jgi:hypothetical protein